MSFQLRKTRSRRLSESALSSRETRSRVRAIALFVSFVALIGPANAEQRNVDFESVLAAPFLALSERLAESGRMEAAVKTKDWVPVDRSDLVVAYHARVTLDIHDPSLREPKVREAFLEARRKASDLAFAGAIESARAGDGEEAYRRLWRALREDPTSERARQLLGFPPGRVGRVTVRPGQEAPAVLGWPDRSFLIGQTENFRVYSVTSKRETLELAEDLQAFFDIWSQIFLSHWIDNQEACRRILEGKAIRPEGSVDLACFADRAAYARAVVGDIPTAELSTGFYAPQHKLTLLYAGAEADTETRYHEVCHQLLQEIGQRVVGDAGKDSGFWLIEGIACYVESLRFSEGYAVIGGWESPRLQYARARWLPQRDPPALIDMIDQGREAVQRREDLAAWYTTSAAYTHYWMDDIDRRSELLRYLRDIYAGKSQESRFRESVLRQNGVEGLVNFLELKHVTKLPPLAPKTGLRVLCLGRTQCTVDDIKALAPQPTLTWLDLCYLPVTDTTIESLVGDGSELARLNLERTKVGDSIGRILERHRGLEEFDASFTDFGDVGLTGLAKQRNLTTLWLTGSKLTDAALPTLLGLRSLESLDVQRTGLTRKAAEQLRSVRPGLQLNPLQLMSQQDQEDTQ